MLKNEKTRRDLLIIALITVMCGVIFFYQTQKTGFHEDEIYTSASAVNPYDGLFVTYGEKDTATKVFEKYIFDDNIFTEIKNAAHFVRNYEDYTDEINELKTQEIPVWKTRESAEKYVTLTPDNYLNFKAIFYNQTKDNHPPLYYTLVHFSSMLFGGHFSKYTAFVVNLAAFIASCFVLKRILELIGKENLTASALILYGISQGCISMVIFQRMYMLMTLFVMLYFYLSVRLYKNDFELKPRFVLALGAVTVLGYLTQYFFAVYALFIFTLMIIKMVKEKRFKTALKYFGYHVLYALIGVMLFIPSLYHLFFTDRGLSNLENSGYFDNLLKYVKHLMYAFSMRGSAAVTVLTAVGLLAGIIYLYRKSSEKFVVLLTVIPGVLFFLVTVKMTSFQELRYIMPVLPFAALTVILVLDGVFKCEQKNVLILLIAAALSVNGLIFSKPKFLYEEYGECIEIAQKYSDRSFVYVYDNIFNHIQSLPEMMIYEKTMIVNACWDQEKYFIEDEQLNSEDSYILCIKSYMDNEKILQNIRDNTDFKNIEPLYSHSAVSGDIAVCNNLYLCCK